jgi:hypothetical protein
MGKIWVAILVGGFVFGAWFGISLASHHRHMRLDAAQATLSCWLDRGHLFTIGSQRVCIRDDALATIDGAASNPVSTTQATTIWPRSVTTCLSSNGVVSTARLMTWVDNNNNQWTYYAC